MIVDEQIPVRSECSIADAVVVLGTALQATPISSFDEVRLRTLLAGVRTAQTTLDSAVSRIAGRANELAARGRSAPAAELLLGAGSIRGRTARAEAGRARAAQLLPGLDEPLARGVVGGDQLDSIVRRLGPLTDEQRVMLDMSRLAVDAVSLPADTFDAVLRRAVAAVATDGRRKTARERQAASEFRHWFDDAAGMGRFCGQLDPERYEAFTTAIDRRTAALAADADETRSKNPNLAAAALVDLVTGSTAPGSRRSGIPQFIVVIGDGITTQTGAGHELCNEAAQRLLCHATVRRVTLDPAGIPINVGRKYRTATDAQWTAIRALHRSCAWHGCQQRIDWCQLHHIRPWQQGGSTDLDNLVPVCSQHHHRVHEGQWKIELLPDRALRIRRPDGTDHATTPAPTRGSPIPA